MQKNPLKLQNLLLSLRLPPIAWPPAECRVDLPQTHFFYIKCYVLKVFLFETKGQKTGRVIKKNNKHK